MYVYADESGHSGRHIFNDPPIYYQGAIISARDVEPTLNPILEACKSRLGAARIHANEIAPQVVGALSIEVMTALDHLGPWRFHVTALEKQYLVATKFVDTIFDSGENAGARWLWYNFEALRHALVILFDDLLTRPEKEAFWRAYLDDNAEGLIGLAGAMLTRLDGTRMDRRLRQVAADGLEAFIRAPEQVTLLAGATRSSYKRHSPNFVAFTSLVLAANEFCRTHGLTPELFCHDQQSEFGPTLRAHHGMFHALDHIDRGNGLPPHVERADRPQGRFDLPASKDYLPLQAVDCLLWLHQRAANPALAAAQEMLASRTDEYRIARSMSELIVRTWFARLENVDMSPEKWAKARETIGELEKRHRTGMAALRQPKDT